MVDGKPEPCPDTFYEFTVELLQPECMIYYNDKYRVRYRVRKVAADHTLDAPLRAPH